MHLPETVVVLVVLGIVVASRVHHWLALPQSTVKGNPASGMPDTSMQLHQLYSQTPGLYHSISQKSHIRSDYSTPSSIAFLFLSAGEANINEALWKSWFPPAEDDRYSIFVHTKPSNTTVPNMPPFFCPHVIPSVESAWYRLHPAMMRLLQHAYTHSHATHFVFVSPTTIPLKPFSEVYEELTSDAKSRFCLTPTGQAKDNWRKVHAQLGVNLKEVAKAELWSSLSRSHVRLILEHEDTLEAWNEAFAGGSAGAPDESLIPTLLKRLVRDQLLTCHGAIDPKSNTMPHGCCATYVKWDGKYNDTYYAIDPYSLDEQSHQQSNAPYFWKYQPCVTHHPCSYDILHERGLRELIQSPHYMFLRKVLPNTVVLTEKGGTIPLAQALPQLHREEPLRLWGQAIGTERDSTFVCHVTPG